MSERWCGRRRTGRQYRRAMNKQKFIRLYEMVTNSYCHYYAGRVDYDFVNGKCIPTGKYIKHMGRNHYKRFLKRESNRKVRRTSDVPNGNMYRRFYEYWWQLY